jgi:predicted naringenin-chalcone synthase
VTAQPHINAIGCATPGHDIHAAFIDWATARLEGRHAALFRRMAERAGIAHRWSVLPPAPGADGPSGSGGFYDAADWPRTARRMAVYADTAPELALQAARALGDRLDPARISHLVVASCTGFVAPGIDQMLAAALGLPAGVERTLIGFMGCYAGVTALRHAWHIVRSQPDARVLVVNVELSTLHLRESDALEPLLAMMLFGDGASAALVTAETDGIALDGFTSLALAQSEQLIRWQIDDAGFAMTLSGEVPVRIGQALGEAAVRAALIGDADPADLRHWAVHAGGRTVLDAVERALALPAAALADSRGVLESFGNMSSATLIFVLKRMLDQGAPGPGVAMAFGPGLAVESFRFRIGG